MAERTTKVRISAQIQEYIAGMEKAAQVTRETGTAGEKLAQKKEAFQQLGQGLLVVGGAMTALTLAVAKTGIEYNILQQTSRAALTTLLGSAEAANAQMDKLDAFARTSPFSKSTFITAQQQMLAFGIESKKVIPYLDAIGEAVAAAGGSNQELGEIAFIMAQISSAGKITAQDLMQFGQRGVNAAELIGSQMGKTGAQIREDISKNALSAGDALDALAAGMKEKFDGASANVKETFAGAMDRVKAAWRDLSADLMTPLVDPNGGGALVDVLNWAADAMRAFEALPEPIKLTGGALFAMAGFVALASGTVLAATPKIVAMRVAFMNLSATMRGFALAGGGAVIALTAVVAVVGAVAAAQAAAEQKAESYADALEQGADAARKLAAENLTTEKSFLWISRGSAADAAETLGLSLDLVTDAAAGVPEALEKVNKVLDAAYADAYTQSMKDVTDQQAAAGEASGVLREYLESETAAYENGTKKLEQRRAATGEAAEAAQTAADAYITEADAVADLNSQMTELIDRINEANGIAGDAITANARYRSALEGISEEVQSQRDAYEEANGTLDGFNASLDQSTASGSANASMLYDVASAAQAAAEKQLLQDQTTMSADEAAKNYLGTLASQRQAFIDAATAAGFNADEVNALAGEIFQMPSEKDVAVIVETAEAHRRIQVLQDALAAVQSVNAIISAIPGKAAGGPIIGPGPKGQDSQLHMLAPGEHVLTAAEVDAAGGHGAIQAFRQALLSGSKPVASSSGSWVSSSRAVTVQPAPVDVSGLLDGMSISGTLDLGNGLTGFVNGVVSERGRAVRRGVRDRKWNDA